jgi:hypothetical protein
MVTTIGIDRSKPHMTSRFAKSPVWFVTTPVTSPSINFLFDRMLTEPRTNVTELHPEANEKTPVDLGFLGWR